MASTQHSMNVIGYRNEIEDLTYRYRRCRDRADLYLAQFGQAGPKFHRWNTAPDPTITSAEHPLSGCPGGVHYRFDGGAG